jgi:hypothetical protein
MLVSIWKLQYPFLLKSMTSTGLANGGFGVTIKSSTKTSNRRREPSRFRDMNVAYDKAKNRALRDQPPTKRRSNDAIAAYERQGSVKFR